MTDASDADFDTFVARIEPMLRRALTARFAVDDVSDAVAESLAYAWEHWPDVQGYENPAGYLFRVAQSRSRSRRAGLLPRPDYVELPDVEPRLMEAVRALPERQRSALWLVSACGWTYAETAEALGISASSVGTHLERALTRIRNDLGVQHGV
jgi:RNA polymerase sigma-70 factor (ECF subfamily)